MASETMDGLLEGKDLPREKPLGIKSRSRGKSSLRPVGRRTLCFHEGVCFAVHRVRKRTSCLATMIAMARAATSNQTTN